jgi:hypothetical protein
VPHRQGRERFAHYKMELLFSLFRLFLSAAR